MDTMTYVAVAALRGNAAERDNQLPIYYPYYPEKKPTKVQHFCGTKNQWEARLSRHNRLTGILDDDGVFGTDPFTRLQLWKMLGEDSGLREWNRRVQAAAPEPTGLSIP